MLDIFNDDAFTNVSLTDGINIAPFVPSRIGGMGIFDVSNPTTHTVLLERKGNVVSLIPSKRRGSGETTKRPATSRDLRPVLLPHIPYDDEVLASDLSGVRQFDTPDAVETVSTVVNEKLIGLRQDHETTQEWLRIGAVKGIVIDGDGTTELVDLFEAFGIVQTEVFFDFAAATPGGIKANCLEVIRYVEESLGGQSYNHVHAMVGNTFFDKLTQADETAEAYNFQTNWQYQIDQQLQKLGTPSIFTYGNIVFENYRGGVGSTKFVGDNDAHFFPVGTPRLFRTYFGPANTMTDVNTPGKPIYVQQEAKRWDEGIDLHSEANPLSICTRPKLLVLGHAGAGP